MPFEDFIGNLPFDLHIIHEVLLVRALRMADVSLLNSTAAFKARALSHGLTQGIVDSLVSKGITSLNQVAYALTPPGTAPSEQALRLFIDADKPEDVTAGQLASIRRWVFEAQTLSVSQLKQQIEGADSKVKELPADERRFRLAEQKRRLAGMELKGPLECSYGSYNMVVQMASDDALQYLSPNRFTTRAQEVLSQKPQKDLILDASHSVKVRDSFTHNSQCDVADPLALSQALTRRSLALDLVGVASFSKAESWNRELLRHLQQSPPPGHRQVDLVQVMRADRAAWLHIAESISSLKKLPDGTLPLDSAFDALPSVPHVTFYLLPTLGTGKGPAKRPDAPHSDSEAKPKTKSARRREALKRKLGAQGSNVPPPQVQATLPRKGRGKGSREGRQFPSELKGMMSRMPNGKRICWDFNCLAGCSNGDGCPNGAHVCMRPKCFQPHPQHKHPA